MKQHPLSAAFPPMSDAEVDALVADVREHGLREPGVVFEGMILDGWHRSIACQRAGVKFVTVDFPNEADPGAFVKSRNLHRRHLTESQRAAAVVACSKWASAGRQPGNVAGSTTADMAREANVSPRTITDAKVAHAAGLGDEVTSGKLTASKAAKKVRGTKRKPPTQKAERPEDRPADAADVTDADADVDPMKEWAAAEERCRALQERVDAFTATDHGAELEKQMRLREIAVRNAEATQNANVQMQRQITKMEGELHRLTGKKRWTDGIAFLKTIVEARAAA